MLKLICLSKTAKIPSENVITETSNPPIPKIYPALIPAKCENINPNIARTIHIKVYL